MGRTDRVNRQDQLPSQRPWFEISGAPRDGSLIELLIPYDRSKFTEEECTDQGRWDAEAQDFDPKTEQWMTKGCFRFNGDDGPYDIQPVAWRPISHG